MQQIMDELAWIGFHQMLKPNASLLFGGMAGV